MPMRRFPVAFVLTNVPGYWLNSLKIFLSTGRPARLFLMHLL